MLRACQNGRQGAAPAQQETKIATTVSSVAPYHRWRTTFFQVPGFNHDEVFIEVPASSGLTAARRRIDGIRVKPTTSKCVDVVMGKSRVYSQQSRKRKGLFL